MRLILILLLVFVLFLTGCNDGVHYFSTYDDANCVIECKNLMQDNLCMSSRAFFNKVCQCVLMDCIVKIPFEQQPTNFTDYSGGLYGA